MKSWPADTADWWRPGIVVDVDAAADVSPAPTAPRLAFGALCAFTVVLVASPQDLVPALAPLRLALVAALVAVAAQLGSAQGRAQVATAPSFAFGIALALLGWTVVTIPWSLWPGGSVAKLLDLYGKSLIVFWLIGTSITRVSRLRALMWTLGLAAAPVALAGLHHWATGQFDRDTSRIAGYGDGLAGNPNDLALTLDIVLPLLLALALSEKRPMLRLVAAGLAVLDAGAIIVTFSRGGFITLVAILGLFLWHLLRRGHWVPVFAVLGLLLLAPAFAPHGFSARLATITDINSDPTGSAQERWHDTLEAVSFIAAHPIVGAGLGQDILALNAARGALWRSVHNAYLNYGVDLGLPGLVLFVWLFAAALLGVRRVERTARLDGAGGSELAALATGVRIGLQSFAVAGFFYPVGYHFYFYYLAGLAVAAQGTHVCLRSRQ